MFSNFGIFFLYLFLFKNLHGPPSPQGGGVYEVCVVMDSALELLYSPNEVFGDIMVLASPAVSARRP